MSDSRTFSNPTTLMVQGTTSDAGKSVLVAGLCRVLRRRGVGVAPFKPQNMALNSAVTVDGGEIGRAQAVQAQACGLDARIDFNPVLLKPNTDIGAQVIIHGKAVKEMNARDYHQYKSVAMGAVLASYERLNSQFPWILVEGAGSPAEINLRDRDIANMGFAEAVDCPVILVADIDRGGVFAHLVGTLELLSASERERVVGLVINKFRGDVKLLEPGIEWLEQRTGKPVLGVLPYLKGFHLEAEDAIDRKQVLGETRLRVVVPVLSRISNHTDFDPLRLMPDVDLVFVGAGESLPACDLIILPGSKSVRADLEHLRQQGWDRDIQRHLRYGGKLMGICGGYQMLGNRVRDPRGIEGPAGETPGLGYLDLDTVLEPDKQLTRVSGTLHLEGACAKVTGYEIHAGVTRGAGLSAALMRLRRDRCDEEFAEGAISADRQILGSYLHGIFEEPEACRALLAWAGLANAEVIDYHNLRERELERLADSLEAHLNLERLF